MMKLYVTSFSDTYTWCEIIKQHVMTSDSMYTHIVTCCHHCNTCYIMLQHVHSLSVIVLLMHNMLQHHLTSYDTWMHMYTCEYISVTFLYDFAFHIIISTCIMSLSYDIRMSNIIIWHRVHMYICNLTCTTSSEML